jgi:broad specificity phosphatase PhoE
MSATVYMVRHAESVSNIGLASSDPATIGLTSRGLAQAKQLARDWPEAPDLIVVSPYVRAQQTAVPLRERFSHVQTETWPVQEFTFFNLRNAAAITGEQRIPLVKAYWERCDPNEKHAEAESFAEFWARVSEFRQRVEGFECERLVVVTHGGFMRAFSYGRVHRFEPCSRALMKALHAWHPSEPYANACVLRIP